MLADERESPELYDFRCGSGVVPCDEGVALFVGGIIGLPGMDLELLACGSEGGGGVFSIESLFRRRASVGLIVRAANPEAWGIVEILREAVEEGVPSFLPVVGDRGDLGGNPTDARYLSGVRDVLRGR